LFTLGLFAVVLAGSFTASGAIGYESTLRVDSVNNRLTVGSQTAPASTLDIYGNTRVRRLGILQLDTVTWANRSLITLAGQNFLSIVDSFNQSLVGVNMFLGYRSGVGAPTGATNMTFGTLSLRSLTSGSGNIAFGYDAGGTITSGSYNLSWGTESNQFVTTGSHNYAFGANSGPRTNISNTIAIGRDSGPLATGQAVIGDGNGNGPSISSLWVSDPAGNSAAASNAPYQIRRMGISTVQASNTGMSSLGIFELVGANPIGSGSGGDVCLSVLFGGSSGTAQATTTTKSVRVLGASGHVQISGSVNNAAATDDGALLQLTGTGSTSSTELIDFSNSLDSTILYARNDRRVGINTATPDVSLDAGDNTDAIKIPSGTTAQEPAVNNTLRFNTDRESLDARENGVMFRLTSSKTPSIAAGAAAGTGPTIAVAGNDLSMKVTLTTGTTATTGALFTVTYASSMDAGVTNYPVFSCADVDCTGLNLYVSAESNTAFTISTQNAPTDGVQYIINIHIGQ